MEFLLLSKNKINKKKRCSMQMPYFRADIPYKSQDICNYIESIYLFNFMYFIFFQVGSIYLFNLLLGTGVLTMPAVFENAGYISGIICLTLLCLISYVQTTFLIESMANANFVKRMQQSNGKFFFNYLIFIITW